MAYNVRSIQDRAKQLLALERRGIVDRDKQARHMRLSISHVSRIRGWIREHGIGAEEKVESGPPSSDPTLQRLQATIEQLRALTSTQLTVSVSKDRLERLSAYCQKKDIRIDSAVNLAIDHYLKTRPR